MFRFPKCPDTRGKWIKAVRRDNWEPNKYSRLCSKHFDKSCFIEGLSLKKLKTDAVPTIFDGYPVYYQPVSFLCQLHLDFTTECKNRCLVLCRHRHQGVPANLIYKTVEKRGNVFCVGTYVNFCWTLCILNILENSKVHGVVLFIFF